MKARRGRDHLEELDAAALELDENFDVCVARWSAALGVAAERARYIGEQWVCQS